jgi:hypothetical protein
MNRDTAVRLAEAGLYVFPCKIGKTPARGFRWQQWAANDPAEIGEMWNWYGANCAPAIHLGPCGLVVVDLDCKPGKPDGVAAFDALLNEHGADISSCPIVETPSGGYHVYFTQPDDIALNCRKGWFEGKGIDIKGDGGYVLAPGAVLDDGTYYEQASGPSLLDAPVIFPWIVDLIEAGRDVVPCAAHVVAGDASDKRRRAWSVAALEREADKVAATAVGGRNHALNRAAYIAGGNAPYISYSEAYDALYGACTANGYITSRDSSDGPKPFKRTFNNAWRAGLAKPLPGPRDAPDPFGGQEIRFKQKEGDGVMATDGEGKWLIGGPSVEEAFATYEEVKKRFPGIRARLCNLSMKNCVCVCEVDACDLPSFHEWVSNRERARHQGFWA